MYKLLQHAASLYFRQNYPTIQIEFGYQDKNWQTKLKGSILTNFAPLGQRIMIFVVELEDVSHAALNTYRNLNEIQFDCPHDVIIDFVKCISAINVF